MAYIALVALYSLPVFGTETVYIYYTASGNLKPAKHLLHNGTILLPSSHTTSLGAHPHNWLYLNVPTLFLRQHNLDGLNVDGPYILPGRHDTLATRLAVVFALCPVCRMLGTSSRRRACSGRYSRGYFSDKLPSPTRHP